MFRLPEAKQTATYRKTETETSPCSFTRKHTHTHWSGAGPSDQELFSVENQLDHRCLPTVSLEPHRKTHALIVPHQNSHSHVQVSFGRQKPAYVFHRWLITWLGRGAHCKITSILSKWFSIWNKSTQRRKRLLMRQTTNFSFMVKIKMIFNAQKNPSII